MPSIVSKDPTIATSTNFFSRTAWRNFAAVSRSRVAALISTEKRSRVKFRSEFFNIPNHPNFGPANNVLTSALFGYSTQSLASSLGSGGPRSIQLALKLQF
jgi:hypothetical protein